MTDTPKQPKPKRKTRPSKLSDARLEAALNALRTGNTRTAAAGYAEIHPGTFHRWIDGDARIRALVTKAEADAEARFMSIIARAANDGSSLDARWWLERRRSEDYRKRDEVQQVGKDGGPLVVKVVYEGGEE